MLKIFKATNTLDNYVIPYEFTQNKKEADVVVIGGKPIDVTEFPALKGIFKTGVGTDNLPYEMAAERGIRIQLPSDETKAVIYDETASFTCYLIMKGLYTGTDAFDTWTKHKRNFLHGRRLLVMGTGKIGGRVVNRMRNFMQVDTYDPLQNNLDELTTLIGSADCISLHMPLDYSTKDFFGSERLALMKEGALLVNTSRGPIVNENELFDVLSAGRIRAAFDVFWEEPYRGKLVSLPEDRFIRTPHIASTCEEFLEGLTKDLIIFCKELSLK